MSTRERWIVYPLLALALGTSMRAKLFPFDVHQFQCEELIVTNRDGGPKVTVRPGGLDLVSADGKTVLILESTPEGGLIKPFDKKSAPHSKEAPANVPQRQPPPESHPKPNALSEGAAPNTDGAPIPRSAAK